MKAFKHWHSQFIKRRSRPFVGDSANLLQSDKYDYGDNEYPSPPNKNNIETMNLVHNSLFYLYHRNVKAQKLFPQHWK
jgi:hypothetical protein